jgi:hypothetical protein
MGGTSGALYDIFFHAVAAQLKQHPPSPTDGARRTTCVRLEAKVSNPRLT